MICPLAVNGLLSLGRSAENIDDTAALVECSTGCAWWCNDDKCCAVKKIPIELIKLQEAIYDKG